MFSGVAIGLGTNQLVPPKNPKAKSLYLDDDCLATQATITTGFEQLPCCKDCAPSSGCISAQRSVKMDRLSQTNIVNI